MSAAPCVIIVADHAGWAHVLSVAAAAGVPAVIDRHRVTTIEGGLPSMPYHHESLGIPVDEADRLIVRVRQSIAEHTARGLARRRRRSGAGVSRRTGDSRTSVRGEFLKSRGNCRAQACSPFITT